MNLIDGRIVQPEEEAVLDEFNRDYLAWVKRHGPEIGEQAMRGDLAAENVILRYNAFRGWLTDWALAGLHDAIVQWERREGASVH